MKSTGKCILTINGGSSSIRFAAYETGETLRRRLNGKIDRIGLSDTNLSVNDPARKPQAPRRLAAADPLTAVGFLLDWLEAQPVFESVKAAGPRVVHGMKHAEPHRVTPYAPDHLPREIALIEVFLRRHPKLPQGACFDTAFRRTLPQVARLLPIPRRYGAKGVERDAFHGLSYAYLMGKFGRLDPAATNGRVILAHLGNGVSLAAACDGKSIDTSMGFTPTAGRVMGARTGDLDPGLVYCLARTEHMTAAQFHQMVNHESGLLGISGTSSDLLALQAADVRTAQAVALSCYQAKKWIGSFAAALGGLDTLVFAGGIGENARLIRERICDGLGFLGIELNQQRNAKNAPLISPDAGRVKVRVIRTDEELMIAKSVSRVLKLGSIRGT